MAHRLTRAALEPAIAHCLAAAPGEGVAALLELEDGGFEFRPLRNEADTARPHGRSAETGFALHPLEWARLERAAEARGVWLVHSHVDGPAELSRFDVATFAPSGRPLLPRLGLVVLSVRGGRCADVGVFIATAGHFVRQPCSDF